MIQEQARTLAAEASRIVFQKPFTDHGRAHRASPFPFNRRVQRVRERAGRARAAAAVMRLNMQDAAEISDPVGDGNTQAGNHAPGAKNLSGIPVALGLQAEIIQDGREDTLQTIEITGNRKAEAIQCQDTVHGDLAGMMEEATATAIYPTNGIFGGVVAAEDMCPASLSPDAYQRRMLAQHQKTALAVRLDLVDETLLHVERSVKVHEAEQIGLKD